MRAAVSGGRALIAALVVAVLSGAARAQDAGCQGACAAPRLDPPEPALRRAVHLSWSDPHRALARSYEIERSDGAAGSWLRVAQRPGSEPAHYDDGAAEALAPGAYAYRLRGLHRVQEGEAWSEWSPAQAVTVRAGCAEAGGELAGLPRVVASDLDGDGRFTGADLERALRRCAELDGCILEALPVAYDDVAIVISNGESVACEKDRTACLANRFSKGLVIEGHGRSTVLRSPLWKTPYQPQPLLELWRRQDLRLQLRHLVLDGRKMEQRDPTPGTNDSNGWRHIGLQVWNRWSDHDQPNRRGCVHDVVVRDFMTRGISLADVASWNIEYGAIEGIGCASGLTPCPRLTVPDAFGPGYTSGGLGIHVDWHSDDVVIRANRIRRATKYSLSFKHGQDGSEASIRRPRVEDNDIDEAGQLGIFLGGVSDGLFWRNRIARTDSLSQETRTRAFNDTFGISCNGVAERTRFVENRIEDMDGMAIMWNCVGRENSIAQSRISGSCRRKGPRSCASGARDCYMQPDVWIVDGAAGTLTLADDEVTDSGCAAPLAVDLNQPDLQVVIRGGRYEAGRLAVQPVRFLAADVLLERGVAFTGTSLSFGPGTRAIVAPDVLVDGRGAPFQVDRQANVLVCPEQRRECERICAGARPPEWCAVGAPALGSR